MQLILIISCKHFLFFFASMSSPDLHPESVKISKPIFLIGFMGSGKSYIGRQLSAAMQLRLVDLDKEFEAKTELSISAYFNQYGEEQFRKTESDLLRTLDLSTPAIVAAGGGTPCFHDNMAWMNAWGITIYLCPPQETIFKRLIQNKEKRPLIADKSEMELHHFIKARIQEREIFYKQAHFSIHQENPSIEDILKQIKTS